MAVLKTVFRASQSQRLAGWLAGSLIASLRTTLRSQDEAPEETRALLASGTAVIGCFWHAEMLSILGQSLVVPERVDFLVSPHRDGLLLATALQRLGSRPCFGSSSRAGGSGLRALLKVMTEENQLVAITPDGPRGPREEAKSGAIKLAQLSGAPLIPLAAAASPAWRFPSWDRFVLPLPFARSSVCWGAPIFVPRDAAGGALEQTRLALQSALKALSERAERRLRHLDFGPGNREAER